MAGGITSLFSQLPAGTGQGLFRRFQLAGRQLPEGSACPYPVLVYQGQIALVIQGHHTGTPWMTDQFTGSLSAVRQFDILDFNGKNPADETGIDLEDFLMQKRLPASAWRLVSQRDPGSPHQGGSFVGGR